MQDALRIIKHTGIADMVAAWRAQDGGYAVGEKRAGRPKIVTDEVVLTLLLLAALLDEPTHVTNVASMLATRIDPDGMAMLGLDRHPPASSEQWYHRASRSLRSLLDVVDPFPGGRHRILHKKEFEVLKEERRRNGAHEKLPRLNRLSDAILQASIMALPREYRRRWEGNTAVDATFVPVFGKRGTTKRSDWVAADPDAAWYVREGDHRDPGVGAKGRTRETIRYGYELEVVSQVANDNDRPEHFPLLTTGVRLHKPGFAPADEALDIYKAMHTAGMPSGRVVGDRIYGSTPAPHQWQGPLRSMGHTLVHDYRVDQLGIQGSFAGALLIEGDFYTPGIPRGLITATLDFREGRIDWDEWQHLIAQRERYLLRRHGKADAEGYQRFACPAWGPNATLTCSLKPLTRTAAPKNGLLPVLSANVPANPDKVCRQQTMMIPPAAGLKYRQDLRFGTPDWARAYSRARNTIEGRNAYLKDEATSALASPGRRRVRGFAAQLVLISLVVAAANIAIIRKWLARLETPTAPFPPFKRKRRRDANNGFLGAADPPDAKTAA